MAESFLFSSKLVLMKFSSQATQSPEQVHLSEHHSAQALFSKHQGKVNIQAQEKDFQKSDFSFLVTNYIRDK